uniref:Uncharacterized protein n=1 Tax=Pinguiococcus pyrenoidosus TaxID=172671 RepID=A0A7R9U9K7_9STRA|mmetsp:Transcript_2353/g.10042  ORF Transcript_2353/g.10042 Transcript_2353/m.10042 type:complete len:105 (+) Transcript_2353:932-1246(+)
MYGKTFGKCVPPMLSRQIPPVALLRGMRWAQPKIDLRNRLPYVYTKPRKSTRLRRIGFLFVLSSDFLRVSKTGENVAEDTNGLKGCSAQDSRMATSSTQAISSS